MAAYKAGVAPVHNPMICFRDMLTGFFFFYLPHQYTIAIQDVPNVGTLRAFWMKQESAGLT